MTVVFLPDNTEFNPYQVNLSEALDREVVFGSGGRYLPILNPVLATEEVSVVHFHWLDLYIFSDSRPKTAAAVVLTVFQLLVIRARGIPMVWTVHNVISHESPYPRLERWFKRGFVRLGFCTHLFVHCEDAADRVLEEYALPESVRERVTVIPHGHYLDNYENEISRDDARARLGFGADELVFLFFGQIKPYKGIFDLLDVFGSIERPEYRLLIAGNPVTAPVRRAIEERATGDDRVRHVLEFIPDDEIQRYMNAADVLVLPYTEISTSGSAILAMSFGKPMIVPRIGCIPETVDEEGTLLYPADADDGLRNALLEAKHRDLPSMGAHNAELVRRYDWSDIADRTARVYSQVTESATVSRVALA